MSEVFGVDSDGAIDIARAAATFDWTWTARDVDRFAWHVGWSEEKDSSSRTTLTIFRRHRTRLRIGTPEAHFALDSTEGLDVVWLNITDARPRRHGPVPVPVFEEVVTRFGAVFGPIDARSETPGMVPHVRWVLPTVTIELCRADTVYLRLVGPRSDGAPTSDDQRFADLDMRALAGAEFAERISIVLAADLGSGFGRARGRGAGPERQPRPGRGSDTRRVTSGTWSHGDIAGLFHDLGWHPEPGLFGGLDADGPHGLSLYASKTADHQERYGYGEFDGVSLVQRVPEFAADEVYRAAVGECVRLLGTPHLVGGPEAFATWRYSDTTVELTRDRAISPGVTLRVVPTEATEWEVGKNEEYGEYGEDWSGNLWELQPDTDLSYALGGRMYYSEPTATAWDELGWNLERLFDSLALDLPVLAPFATEIAWEITGAAQGQGIARGWFAPGGCMLEIHRGHRWDQRMYSPGAGTGGEIAAATMAAIRDSGAGSPRDLEVRAEATQHPQRLHTVRFGIGSDEFGWERTESSIRDFAPPRPSAATPRVHGEWEWTAGDDEDFLRRLLASAGNAAGTVTTADEDRWVVPPRWRAGAESFRGVAGSTPPAVDPRATEALVGILDVYRPRLIRMLDRARAEGSDALAHAAATYLAAPGTSPSPLGAAVIWVLVRADHHECCRAAFPHADHVERDILPRFVDSWLTCYGLAFAAETLVLARGLDVRAGHPIGTLTSLGPGDCGPAAFDSAAVLVRSHLAISPEPVFRHVVAHLAEVRARLDTVWARLATSYLVPQRQDWLDADLALTGLARHNHSVSMLATSLTRPDQYARLCAAAGRPTLVGIGQLHSLLAQVGPDSLDVVSDWVEKAVSRRKDMSATADILAWIPTDGAYEALLELREHEEVHDALCAATTRYPHRALRLLGATVEPRTSANRRFDPLGLFADLPSVRARTRQSGPVPTVPVVSLTLVGLCVAVYVISALQAHSFSPTPRSSSLYGQLMLSRDSVARGEVWRVLTGGLVAGNPIMLLVATVGLVGFGYYLETFLGHTRTAAIHLLSTASGAAVVMWLITDHANFGITTILYGSTLVFSTIHMMVHGFDRFSTVAGATVAFWLLVGLWTDPVSTAGTIGAIVAAVLATIGFFSGSPTARTRGWLLPAAIGVWAALAIGVVIALL